MHGVIKLQLTHSGFGFILTLTPLWLTIIRVVHCHFVDHWHWDYVGYSSGSPHRATVLTVQFEVKYCCGFACWIMWGGDSWCVYFVVHSVIAFCVVCLCVLYNMCMYYIYCDLCCALSVHCVPSTHYDYLTLILFIECCVLVWCELHICVVCWACKYCVLVCCIICLWMFCLFVVLHPSNI